MEFHIHLASPAADRANLAALGENLQQADPAALVDFQADTGVLRVATWLEAGDIAAAFAATGHPLAMEQIQVQPSVCCGGCSG